MNMINAAAQLVPGSARASRAGEGAIAFANFHFPVTPPILFSQQSPSRRGAATSTRGRVRSPEKHGDPAGAGPWLQL